MNSKRIERNFEFFRTIMAVVIALGLGLLVILLISDQPFKAMGDLITGPLSTKRRFGNVLELMIPYMFTGSAICVMFQANQFNMIADGAFLFSACIGTWFCTSSLSETFAQIMPGTLGTIVFITLTILIAGISGMICASIPALLKIKWRANEVVSSIMLNTILLQLANYILKNVMIDSASGFTASKEIPANAIMPNIWNGTRVHVGIIIALVVCVIMYFFIYKTRWGYQIRVVGYNQNFARYSGISIVTVALMSQLIGGFIAGMGGIIEIQGMYSRYNWVSSTGHGFDGMLVGILAKNNPVLVPVTAFLLAYLRTGADVMNRNTDVPAELIQVVQALVIMLVAANMLFSGLKHKMIVRDATRTKKVSAAKEGA